MKTIGRIFVLGLIAIAALALSSRWALASSHGIDEQTYAVAKKLNCPTCVGRSLADCDTVTCYQWKQDIQAQLKAGKTEAEVLDYFKARFGPTVLQEPPKEGGILVLWTLPVAAFVALVLVAVFVARRVSAQRAAIAESVVTPPAATDDFVEQIERQVSDIS